MKIIIEAEPKEIAELICDVQARQDAKVSPKEISKQVIRDCLRAEIHDTTGETQGLNG